MQGTTPNNNNSKITSANPNSMFQMLSPVGLACSTRFHPTPTRQLSQNSIYSYQQLGSCNMNTSTSQHGNSSSHQQSCQQLPFYQQPPSRSVYHVDNSIYQMQKRHHLNKQQLSESQNTSKQYNPSKKQNTQTNNPTNTGHHHHKTSKSLDQVQLSKISSQLQTHEQVSAPLKYYFQQNQSSNRGIPTSSYTNMQLPLESQQPQQRLNQQGATHFFQSVSESDGYKLKHFNSDGQSQTDRFILGHPQGQKQLVVQSPPALIQGKADIPYKSESTTQVRTMARHQKGGSWGGDNEQTLVEMKENRVFPSDLNCVQYDLETNNGKGNILKDCQLQLAQKSKSYMNKHKNWLEKIMKPSSQQKMEEPIDISMIKGDKVNEQSFLHDTDQSSCLLMLPIDGYDNENEKALALADFDVNKSFNLLETLPKEMAVNYSNVEDVSLVVVQQKKMVFQRKEINECGGSVDLVIDNLRERISSVEKENKELREIVDYLNAKAISRETEFKQQIDGSMQKSKDRIDELIRQITSQQIRIDCLNNEYAALKKQQPSSAFTELGDDQIAVGKDVAKLIKCLTEMIANITPLGCVVDAQPSMKQIWKWLKCVLSEYVNLKTGDAQMHKVLGVNPSEDVQEVMRMIIDEHHNLKQIVQAFAPYFLEHDARNRLSDPNPIEQLEKFFGTKLKRSLA